MTEYGRLFRSAEEQIEPVEGEVSGTIPDWIEGDWVIIGPAVFDLNENFTVNHYFDGFGIVSKFSFQNGKVMFSKRLVDSDAYKKAKSAGKTVYTEFGTKAHSDPSKNMFQKLMNNVLPELTDNDASNVFTLGKTTYVSTETCMKRILNKKTLETGKKVDLSQNLKIDLTCSHVYYDPDGTAYALGTALTAGFKTQIFKVPPKCKTEGNEFGEAEVLCVIPTRGKLSLTYCHSFGMSENYIVFVEQPMFIPGMKLVTAQAKGKSMSECMEWHPDELNKFTVIDKKNGKALSTYYESNKPFFFFHHINTYEKDGELIVDLIAHDSPEVIEKMLLKNLRASKFNLKDKALARRFVLPLIGNISDLPENTNLVKTVQGSLSVRVGNKIKVNDVVLTEGALELPIVNQNYFGRPYKYFYAAGLYDQSKFRNSIVKVNVDTGETLTWKKSNTTFPGEPLFIPHPKSTAEDDGVVLVNVTEVEEGLPDFLQVLDAKNMKEIGKAILSVHSPHLLHGTFIH